MSNKQPTDGNKPLLRVIITENNLLIRQGIVELLQTSGHCEIIGEANTGAEAVEQCRNLSPDIVLMDFAMPVLDGISATRHILEEQPHIKIVILSNYLQKSLIEDALRAGVADYITKDISSTQLVARLRRVMEDDIPKKATGFSPTEVNFTSREMDILIRIVDDLDLKVIAEQLGISINTVKTHTRNIYQKLGVHSRQDAIMAAIRYKILT